ncbi:hypothetical protein QFZ27_004165 [Inquilinus ginsengisoli]|uniref:hypothetical protein n=1 Tax=Inquilinus ginsengisoli TaxID=363840 RepID=UPI003D1C1A91
MPWFAFATDFDFRPARRIILAYRAGTTLLIPAAAADAAEAAGAGRRAPKPKEPTHERP